MRKNRPVCLLSTLLAFTLLHSACAQIPVSPGQAYVNEEKLVQKTTFLFNNQQQIIPLLNLAQAKIASVHFSYVYAAGFDSLLNKYSKVDVFNAAVLTGAGGTARLSQDLKLYNTVIVEVTAADLASPETISFIAENQRIKKVIVALFGDGILLNKLTDITAPIVLTSRLSPISALCTAQMIFGGIAINQKPDRTYSAKYTVNSGYLTAKTRLQYTAPEDAGINAANLTDIDNIANEAMADHATPGCVVLVAKDGKVIFNRAYGFHTYAAEQRDNITDIFDLASVTKVSATTPSVMRLVEQGKLNLDSTIGSYLPIARGTNKNDIRLRELMTHQAGLIPDIPTYERLKPSDHSPDSSADFPTKVVDNYYLRKNYFYDVMWPEMLRSPLRTRGQYVYSDLSMYFTKEIVEAVTAQPLNVYVQQQFYAPLGMQTAGFLPLNRFPAERIVPTEDDHIFRHVLLDGYVHDQGAALAGGVSGHAGLFATSNDLAILFQMLLNRGTYGGMQYFKPETVDLFTAKQSDVSRRGLGFDRWDPVIANQYPSSLASPQTFGHTGYTGICVWVDPKYNLVYVFLSNRVNPKVTNKLSNLRIRGRIQDVVYEAIQKGL